MASLPLTTRSSLQILLRSTLRNNAGGRAFCSSTFVCNKEANLTPDKTHYVQSRKASPVR